MKIKISGFGPRKADRPKSSSDTAESERCSRSPVFGLAVGTLFQSESDSG